MLASILMAITLFFVLLMTLVIGVLWTQMKNTSIIALYTYEYLYSKNEDFSPKNLLNRNPPKKET
jgi:hypothetical protein